MREFQQVQLFVLFVFFVVNFIWLNLRRTK